MTYNQLEELNKEVQLLAESKRYHFGRYLPNNDVMFVAEMGTDPGTKWNPYDNFNLSNSDHKFIEIINKCGLGGSYITDAIKETNKADRPTKEQIEKYIPILRKEIEIINPKIIVALGDSAFNILKENIFFLDIRKIWHPAYARRTNKWDEYEKQISDLLES